MRHKAVHSKKLFLATAITMACIVSGMFIISAADVLYENTANKHWESARYEARANNPANLAAVDSCTKLLHTGDLLVRRGDDMTSYMLSQLNMQDQTYSHCGLVMVENGYPFVYHSIGGEDNPDQALRRDSAQLWCSPANNHAFAAFRYALADSINDKLVKSVRGFYKERIKFDMSFDMETDDRLYCSEMIYKAIEQATGGNSFIAQSNNYGRAFVGIDDLYCVAGAQPVCRIRFK